MGNRQYQRMRCDELKEHHEKGQVYRDQDGMAVLVRVAVHHEDTWQRIFHY